MLVEFVGAAGVGKSFLAEKTCLELLRRGLPASMVERTRMRKVSTFSVLTVFRSAVLTFSLEPKSLPSFVSSIRRMARYKIRLAPYLDGRICIADEGAFQQIRALYRNSRSLSMAEIAERVFRYLELPDAVVVVSAPAETILARRTGRRRASDNLDPASIERDVALLEDSIATIRHVQLAVGKALRMLRVEVDQDEVAAVAEQIANFVEAGLRRRCAAARRG